MIDFFLQIHSQIMDPSRFPVAVLALVLAAIVGVITGPMHGNANSFIWLVVEKIFGGFGDRLDRKSRSSRNLLTRGLFFTFLAAQCICALGINA